MKWIQKLLLICLCTTMFILLGCTDPNFEPNDEAKEKILGLWQWEGNNQTGNWTFYENNTLKSVFTGILPTGEYGSSSVVIWEYEISDTELSFTSPDKQYDPAIYIYEFLEQDTILRVTYEGNTAEWHKVNE